jgi:superfamily II DNA or RNA helicase
MWRTSRRLLLGDDVGLGKTVSALAGLSEPDMLPALVVTLTHLPRQWKAEINRFLPDLKVHILRKGSTYDLLAKRENKGRWPDVLISNYQKLGGWADELAGKVKTVIFDEAQELRIPGSFKHDAALLPRREGRIRHRADGHAGLQLRRRDPLGDQLHRPELARHTRGIRARMVRGPSG